MEALTSATMSWRLSVINPAKGNRILRKIRRFGTQSDFEINFTNDLKLERVR